MVSDWELKLRLRVESARWKNELRTDYIDGIIRGLAIAVEIARQLRKETYLREQLEKQKLKASRKS